MSIGLFVPCFTDAFFSEVGVATLELLERFGHEVAYPRPRLLIDACFIAAAQASADQVGPDLRAKGMLFPSQANILETEITTATRIAEFMFDQGLAQAKRPRDTRTWIEGQLYRPVYPE